MLFVALPLSQVMVDRLSTMFTQYKVIRLMAYSDQSPMRKWLASCARVYLTTSQDDIGASEPIRIKTQKLHRFYSKWRKNNNGLCNRFNQAFHISFAYNAVTLYIVGAISCIQIGWKTTCCAVVLNAVSRLVCDTIYERLATKGAELKEQNIPLQLLVLCKDVLPYVLALTFYKGTNQRIAAITTGTALCAMLVGAGVDCAFENSYCKSIIRPKTQGLSQHLQSILQYLPGLRGYADIHFPEI